MSDASLKMSVIIPTFNRSDLLPRCLESLRSQTLGSQHFEVVIVDDGSTDGTAELLKNLIPTLPFSVSYVHQQNRGPAAARNRGIAEAKAPLIWITGDDYMAEPECLEAHYQWHTTKHPEPETVVLGYATFHPDLEVTDIMHWVENGGLQFYYFLLHHGEEIPPTHFITCNISFKKSFFEAHGPFDERYPYAMGEDTDLGFRFALAEMRFYYNEKAIAYHYHPLTEEDNIRRVEILGETLIQQEENWPGLHRLDIRKIPYQWATYHVIKKCIQLLRPFIDSLPTPKRRFILRRYFRIQEILAIARGIKRGFEKNFRKNLQLNTAQTVLLLPGDFDEPFYRYADKVKRDHANAAIVLVDKIHFKTKLRLVHRSVDWFIIHPGNLNLFSWFQDIARDIRQLKPHTACLLSVNGEFDPSTILFLKSLGISQIKLYGAAPEAIPIKWKPLLRSLISYHPMLQTSLWRLMGFIHQVLSVTKDLLLFPLYVLRFLITRLLGL